MKPKVNDKPVLTCIATKDIFGYKVKGTKEQLDEMFDLLNAEDYRSPSFRQYFHVWISKNNTGVYWFPREEFYGGEEPYVFALFEYAGFDVEHSRYDRKETDND